MSDTPRTDAATKSCTQHPDYVFSGFARELERELATVVQALRYGTETGEPCAELLKIQAENATLQAQVRRQEALNARLLRRLNNAKLVSLKLRRQLKEHAAR